MNAHTHALLKRFKSLNMAEESGNGSNYDLSELDILTYSKDDGFSEVESSDIDMQIIEEYFHDYCSDHAESPTISLDFSHIMLCNSGLQRRH